MSRTLYIPVAPRLRDSTLFRIIALFIVPNRSADISIYIRESRVSRPFFLSAIDPSPFVRALICFHASSSFALFGLSITLRCDHPIKIVLRLNALIYSVFPFLSKIYAKYQYCASHALLFLSQRLSLTILSFLEVTSPLFCSTDTK